MPNAAQQASYFRPMLHVYAAGQAMLPVLVLSVLASFNKSTLKYSFSSRAEL